METRSGAGERLPRSHPRSAKKWKSALERILAVRDDAAHALSASDPHELAARAGSAVDYRLVPRWLPGASLYRTRIRAGSVITTASITPSRQRRVGLPSRLSRTPNGNMASGSVHSRLHRAAGEEKDPYSKNAREESRQMLKSIVKHRRPGSLRAQKPYRLDEEIIMPISPITTQAPGHCQREINAIADKAAAYVIDPPSPLAPPAPPAGCALGSTSHRQRRT